MFDSLKASAKAGADATARAAKSTKLKGEIMMLEQKLTTTKKDFGNVVYDSMASGDQETTDRLFNETRTKIEAIQADITAKKAEVESLKNARITPVATSCGQSGTLATTAAAAPSAAPPPPPMGVAVLPPGWKQATSPDGKVYYYHEQTGETSWQYPQ